MKPVRLSALATKDLQQISQTTAADRPMAAAAFGRQLIQRRQSLANAPEGYGLRLEFGLGVRGVTVPPYIVRYRIREQDVLILSVRHRARKPVAFK